MILRTGKKRSVTVHKTKEDAHNIKDNVKLTRAEFMNDQMFISKHGNEYHGSLHIYNRVNDSKGNYKGIKKKVINFVTEKPIKDPKKFGLTLRKKVADNVKK